MDSKIKVVDLDVEQVPVGYFEDPDLLFLNVRKVIDVTGLRCGEDKRDEEKIFAIYSADNNGPIVQLRTEGHAISFRMTDADSLMSSNGFQLNASLNDLKPFELATEIIKNSPNYEEASWRKQ